MSSIPGNKSRLGSALGQLATGLGHVADGAGKLAGKLEAKGGLRQAVRTNTRAAANGVASLPRRAAGAASEEAANVQGKLSTAANSGKQAARSSLADLLNSAHRHKSDVKAGAHDLKQGVKDSVLDAGQRFKSEMKAAAQDARAEVREGFINLQAGAKREASGWKQEMKKQFYVAARTAANEVGNFADRVDPHSQPDSTNAASATPPTANSRLAIEEKANQDKEAAADSIANAAG
jgi:X-X-X-Leu-X-X-Gly heptad repeat protein